jgi:hypothetical protein
LLSFHCVVCLAFVSLRSLSFGRSFGNQVWNYSKTSRRGAADVVMYLDDVEIFRGGLRKNKASKRLVSVNTCLACHSRSHSCRISSWGLLNWSLYIITGQKRVYYPRGGNPRNSQLDYVF